jgi:hypothetical protein
VNYRDAMSMRPGQEVFVLMDHSHPVPYHVLGMKPHVDVGGERTIFFNLIASWGDSMQSVPHRLVFKDFRQALGEAVEASSMVHTDVQERMCEYERMHSL